MIFKLHHRLRDITLDFEACTVGEAIKGVGWNSLHVTVIGWTCPECEGTGITVVPLLYCTCPYGELIKARHNDDVIRSVSRKESPMIQAIGG